MDTIAISKFKATCLGLLERVKKTGEPLLVTKNGQAIALVSAPPRPARKKSPFGLMKGSAQIKGDIIRPLPLELWTVLKK